ncbi:hypothetical protein Plec18170_009702 [Paecilomyces lecythidis]
MNQSAKPFLEILLTLPDESLFRWQAELALVVHHWERIPIFENFAAPRKAQRIKICYHNDSDVQGCLRTLYYLSDQQVLAHQMMITEQILPRLRHLKPIQDRTISRQAWAFERQIRNDAQRLTILNRYNWAFIIFHVKKKGDPRVVPVILASLESPLPYQERLLYILCCRHHAQAYWGLYGKRHALEDSRSSGHIAQYALQCGLEPVRRLQDAVKIGLRLLTIEEMIGAPGISLLMIFSCRQLLQLRSWTLKQWVFIMEEIKSDILSSARQQTSRIQTLQTIFNEEVVRFLAPPPAS